MTSKNPFDDDDDNFCYKDQGGNDDQSFSFYEKKIDDTLADSLASTQRSMQALAQSEEVGIETAKDLDRQGEKLKKIDETLDEMDQTTKETQRHLNSIKSVFGGIRNYFSRSGSSSSVAKSASGTPGTAAGDGSSIPSSASASKLNKTVGKLEESDSYVPTDGKKGGKKGGDNNTKGSARIEALGGTDTRWGAMDAEIDENLDDMSQHLSRLKALGGEMGNEIDKQNDLLDTIDGKVLKTDMRVRQQDAQMKKILGTKKDK